MSIENKPTDDRLPTEILPPYLKMYEISGQDTITEHGFKRYIKNKEQDHAIRNQQKNSSVFIQKIENAPHNERVALIKLGLDNPNIEMQRQAVEMIEWVPDNELRKLFDLAIQMGFDKELIKPPLYNKDIDTEHFSRQAFEKTGSGTTLVGGKLKDKAIVRHIKPKAFLAWQRLYEDYTLWQNAGFDYVPIEPILSYRLNKEGLVDVFSGVLDLNLSKWEKTDMFTDKLQQQKDKILEVLDTLNIQHGHAHEQNFCLRFFRDENGGIDFKRIPRLYLIDFDQAVSP